MEGKDYISVQQLVESVNSMTGEFSGIIDLGNDDKFDQKLMILVNDKFVAAHDLLYQGDTVKILPNMAGGWKIRRQEQIGFFRMKIAKNKYCIEYNFRWQCINEMRVLA